MAARVPWALTLITRREDLREIYDSMGYRTILVHVTGLGVIGSDGLKKSMRLLVMNACKCPVRIKNISLNHLPKLLTFIAKPRNNSQFNEGHSSHHFIPIQSLRLH